MIRLASISLLISFILLLNTGYMLGRVVDNSSMFNTDTIETSEEKIEYLLNYAQKLYNLNSSLDINAVSQACYLSKNSNNKDLIAKCNVLKGVILSKMGDTEGSLQLLKSSLKYYEEENDKSNGAITLTELGNTYFNNNQFAKASLYYNSALADFIVLNDSTQVVACYTYIGQADVKLRNNNKARDHFIEAINISINNNYDFFLVMNYIELSKLQLSLGLTDSIFNHLGKAFKIAKQQRFADLIGEVYLTLADYYSVSGNQRDASHQLKLYISYSDSINIAKTIELENIILNLSDLETDTKDNNNSNLWYWLFIAALFLGIIFLINKIINQKSIFGNQMYIITTELDAYKESSNDLDEIVKQKTTKKNAEIKNEISNNINISTALNDSLNNLNNVNNLKDIFLSKISHEIRTPLSGILGFSEILETELALLEDPSLYEFANSISQSGQSLVLLLNNILDISRLDSNNMVVDFKQHNTKELIQSIVDSHFPEASTKGIKLIYAHTDIPDIYTDNQLFAKIISLILNNAIKFTEKGFIKLSHFYDDVDDSIVVSIKDTGIGIDKVYIDQVFEPFRQESLGYSTSYQGAGLGLPLAKKMSLKLNGDIKIESEKGSGTTITLSFPAFSANIENRDVVDKQESKIIHPQNKFPWDELSVLVVEDDNMNQILYRKLLKTSRYLEIAKDGKSALAIVEKQISNNNFQLVLMDINLPEPWDGISLMKEIRNKWPDYKNIPFIAQTAYAISGNRELMLEEGFDEYITKPIIKSALIETINKVIST